MQGDQILGFDYHPYMGTLGEEAFGGCHRLGWLDISRQTGRCLYRLVYQHANQRTLMKPARTAKRSFTVLVDTCQDNSLRPHVCEQFGNSLQVVGPGLGTAYV